MAKELNKIQLTGRLGADPEMRFTPQGHAVTTFRVASNRSWRSADGEGHEDTEWFRVVAWNKLAEICNQFLIKGARVYVEGRLQTRQWQDQEGQTRSSTEVIANDMIMLDTRRDTPSVDDDTRRDTSGIDDDIAPEPVAASARAARQTAVAAPPPAAAPARSAVADRPTAVAAPPTATKTLASRAAKVAPLPRGKPAFEEEDLPF